MNIGLVAYDSKKKLMQNFCIAYQGILRNHHLYATATTGHSIESITTLKIQKFLSGHLGGQQQLGSLIEQNELDLLVIFRDPMAPKKYEQDTKNITRLCDVYNIPMATNIATAEALILALDRGDLDWREMYK